MIIDDDKYSKLREWTREYIDSRCIYRGEPIPGKIPGTVYTWQFYLRRGLFDYNFLSAISQMFLYKIEKEIGHFDFQIETQLNSVKNFFDNKVNLNILKELKKILEVKNDVTKDKNGLLNEKTFMVTGKLNGISRAEVKSLIEENSGSSVSTVSKKLNYLIIGDKPTKKKVDKAKELKVTILNQSQFLKMLNISG